MIRGAFDYQGQKCSAASRAFVPRSVWARMGDDFLDQVPALRYGDVTDLSNFGGAVIDQRAFDKNAAAIERAKATPGITVAAGGTVDDSEGFFVAPTVLLGDDPTDEAFSDRVLRPDPLGARLRRRARPRSPTSCAWSTRARPYALTGAVIATDRAAVAEAAHGPALRRRQLLRQRQADRRRRRPAAVRRRPGLRHERQGRLARRTCSAGPPPAP